MSYVFLNPHAAPPSPPSPTEPVEARLEGSLRHVASVPTVWWLTFAFLGYNFAANTVNAFTVPLLQRYFGLSLGPAAAITGVVVGLTGLAGLTLGGRLADRARRRSARRRVLLGAACLATAAPLTLIAFMLGDESAVLFAAVFGLGWLLGYVFYTCCYPAVSDVIEPRLRGTAVALVFAVGYLLGGALGPLFVGVLADSLAEQARIDAGATELTTEFRGSGLHDAMLLLVPVSLAVAASGMFMASRTVAGDEYGSRSRRPPP